LRGDVVRLGRQRVSRGVLTFRMEKNRGDRYVYPPVLPILAETIAATKTGDLTFLVTERGLPFSKEGFGNWFRDAGRAAGCPNSCHGLRNAGATRAADNRATTNQLMARCSDGKPRRWRCSTRRRRIANDSQRRRLHCSSSEKRTKMRRALHPVRRKSR